MTRRSGSRLPVALVLVLAACSQPPVDTSPMASSSPAVLASGAATEPASAAATPSVSPTVPVPTATATASPSVDPIDLPEFAYSDILEVMVDGLAVREGPTLSSPLMDGERSHPDGTVEAVENIRLDAGSFVSVHLGPLPADGIVWYLVWPAEDAQLNYSTLWWHTDGNADHGVEPGWIAASVGDDVYLALHRRPDPTEYLSWPAGGPRTMMASGTGDHVSPPMVQHDLYALHWAAAADAVSPCSLSVSLVPDGGDAMIAVEASATSVAQGPLQGTESIVSPPWEPAPDGSRMFTVRVTSTCAWAILLMPLPHD